MDREKEVPAAADLGLARLKELKNFEVVDGDHDIRGWKVRAPEGTVVGKVDELIVDQAERKVRYIEIEVDRKALHIDHNRHVLVPIGAVGLNAEKKDVLLERLPLERLAGLPAYKSGPITRDYETSLRNYYGAAATGDSGDYYRDDIYSDARLRRGASAEFDAAEVSALPKFGDNEVTVPLAEGQEVVIRKPGSNDEIVIRKGRTAEAEKKD